MVKAEKVERLLEFIRDFIEQKGYAPTMGEIKRSLAISSTSVVDRYLKVLEQQGRIRRDRKVSRAIELSDMGNRAVAVPVLGVIAAGQPVHVPREETWHTIALDTIEIPPSLVPKGVPVFALRVKGTSMIDAFVNHGDIVILAQVPAVEDGQMVAVWLSDRDETTLKKLYREPDRIRLQPANRAIEPIYVDPECVEIQGRVIAVVRKLW
jgi:repressor LexA